MHRMAFSTSDRNLTSSLKSSARSSLVNGNIDSEALELPGIFGDVMDSHVALVLCGTPYVKLFGLALR